jgi:hypothetical protein
VSIEDLRSPIVIAAFAGWNDAGEAASAAVSHLHDALEATFIARIDPDDYYDFQVNRPVGTGDYLADLQVSWPTTWLSAGTVPGADVDLLLIRGIEPNMRWQTFTTELINLVRKAHAPTVINLAALLADAPHTKPVRVTATMSNPGTATRYDAEHSPAPGIGSAIGISTIFATAAAAIGLDSILLWASVPHYVSAAPSPKVTLALLHEIANHLGLEIPLGDMPEDARAWERGVDELAEQDPEVMEYIKTLEGTLP